MKNRFPRLSWLALCLLILTFFIAPLNRIDKHNNAVIKPSDIEFRQSFPLLISLGTYDAANQGPYKISGYQHASCEGSIALLPLFRNAEGSHILKRLVKDSGTRYGVIFRGDIHPTFPQFEFTLARLENAIKALATPVFSPSAKPLSGHKFTLAFAEQGQCQIAEYVARYVL